ncbi:competence protein F [Reinekea sp. MED297]|uniref:Competence protein F n=1 Tax=Reinekea blandensis MED297 TaxID=314283 RepID=A4BGD3_9GAMM|nr:competence protein F [Reinekea sp. MED297] [Reinekea blandensis MED297]
MQSAPDWDALHIPWRFDGLTRFLIHRYKYQRDRAAGHALLRQWHPPVHQHTPQALLAVPMHHRKQARSGFNHADDMVQFLSKSQQLPIYRDMTRQRSTRPLEGLNKAERKRELKDCFILKSPPPERVAIIDDVMTTGSTVAEITRTLKRHGTRFVTVWALARTPLSGSS